MARLCVIVGGWLLTTTPTTTIAAAPADAADQILAATFRHVADVFCRKIPCYLAVDGEPPAEAILRCLRDLPNTRSIARRETAVKPDDEIAFVINLRQLEPLPDGTARVHDLITVGTRAVSSCWRLLSSTEAGWRVDSRKTTCDLI